MIESILILTMKKFLKIIAIIVIIIVVGVIGLLVYVTQLLPNIDAPDDLEIELTPERIERGTYLATEIMGCVACHGQRDFSRFAGPIIVSTKGSGGEYWGENLNFPGKMYAPNITPFALGNWTDGEIFRAITSGVNKDGEALFPIMPYHQYGKLPKEDIYAVIAYLRQLEPIEKSFPKRELNFPLNIIVNLMPKKGQHQLKPDDQDIVKNGEYIITAAACFDCHTPMEKGRFVEHMAFAGGLEFPIPTGGIVRSANLTPDKETGIGNWTKEMFIARFKTYSDSSYTAQFIKQGDYNTYMPWEYYAHLKESDLAAIYSYLMALEPISNKVEKFSSN